jgi:hypothetical protein
VQPTCVALMTALPLMVLLTSANGLPGQGLGVGGTVPAARPVYVPPTHNHDEKVLRKHRRPCAAPSERDTQPVFLPYLRGENGDYGHLHGRVSVALPCIRCFY